MDTPPIGWIIFYPFSVKTRQIAHILSIVKYTTRAREAQEGMGGGALETRAKI